MDPSALDAAGTGPTATRGGIAREYAGSGAARQHGRPGRGDPAGSATAGAGRHDPAAGDRADPSAGRTAAYAALASYAAGALPDLGTEGGHRRELAAAVVAHNDRAGAGVGHTRRAARQSGRRAEPAPRPG